MWLDASFALDRNRVGPFSTEASRKSCLQRDQVVRIACALFAPPGLAHPLRFHRYAAPHRGRLCTELCVRTAPPLGFSFPFPRPTAQLHQQQGSCRGFPVAAGLCMEGQEGVTQLTALFDTLCTIESGTHFAKRVFDFISHGFRFEDFWLTIRYCKTPRSVEWLQTTPSLFRTAQKSLASATVMCRDTSDFRSRPPPPATAVGS